MTLKKLTAVGAASAIAASLALYSAGALATKDYLVTAARPNLVFVADAKERKVVATHKIPNTSMGNSPITLVPSRDGKVAYVIHNRWETVSGIDLESGKEMFRAELSGGDIRGKAPYAMDLSPDGKELAVFVNPTQLLPGEYKALDPYIAVYRTDAGTDAKPVRKLPTPRRVSTLAYSGKGDTLYAFSWDMLKLDPQTGAVKGTHPWRSWQRPDRGEPDTLAIWPQWEQTNVFATPFYVASTDKPAGDPAALRAGIWALDLENDTVTYKEFENASVVLFSSAVNPVRRNEVYTVYTQLTRTDMNTGKMDRVDLDHTYYNVNVSSDGSELYIGGTQGDIAVYDSKSLKRIGNIRTPGGGDQVLTSLRIVSR
ncbi:quinohemoprotein amine dehydrogenase subunit beta [Aromatoleum aromaticum]|uniref:Quinohemoprotein amine dehydrogenase, subunit beta n=1 Tax=Aromatoleum aromaticum (strain DSM 19018 / LMG 30748 / EbN1) TaxID=76114 RepID=Q5P5Q9_AROAE|nr:quinohemoprotein amine dehydrogenase subunit beta [Aromatoleum aromaticum]NMG53936.1 quinohemoprotein amine dehydrogenase subunit beta [Aromatoleum aromaticum]CAI07353.1 quinohemoprotein amine dehydrogenase, subunit beta [Aromatoleum aromaticum EbN1]